jgi:hypothetical protein
VFVGTYASEVGNAPVETELKALAPDDRLVDDQSDERLFLVGRKLPEDLAEVRERF